MDWSLSAAEVEFREAARSWLRGHVPSSSLPSMDTAAGFRVHREWERELFDGGWAAVTWPRRFGGRDASVVEWLLFEEEYYAAGAPGRVTQNGVFLLGPTLLEVGSEEQKERLLRPMAAAEETWAQAWSEPDAGSDLAAVRSAARRADGGWRLSGQKTWTTRGAFADRAFGLFRTDPKSERHRGLTYFMFPLRGEGVTVNPVRRLDGAPGFAEVFLDDLFVGDADVIGEVGRGWQVAMSTTTSERGMTLRSPGRFLQAARELAELRRRRGNAAFDAAVVDCLVDAAAYRARGLTSAGRALARQPIGAEASVDKLFWSQLDLRIQRTALALLGPAAPLAEGAEAEAGRWLDRFLFALAGPIYAGTNEIQRNIIAQRVLGMPRP
ncbi:MAG TPA: acyl-CoA dehydrogenase family protein [Solirubrobacterales bacterium]|nr:acyl-CoA dehydrogenase family protein [Solirubrobacterales bacterium]